MNVDSKKQIQIINRLNEFGSVPVSTSTLKSVLSDYDHPNNKISNLAVDGYLIRLKKGLYAVSPEITGNPINKYVISNNIYGSSYVSYQSALHYYGLIPEAVITTTAVTFKRSKSYITSIGTIKYYHVPFEYYSVGFTTVFENDNSYAIALKEKALCDLIVLNRGSKLQSTKAMTVFLEEDMRVDMEQLEDFDMNVIDACLDAGVKKNEITLLKQIINEYK